jgi:hypothetical protein
MRIESDAHSGSVRSPWAVVAAAATKNLRDLRLFKD